MMKMARYPALRPALGALFFSDDPAPEATDSIFAIFRPEGGKTSQSRRPAPEATDSIFAIFRPEDARTSPSRQPERRDLIPRAESRALVSRETSKKNLFFPESKGETESLFSFLQPKDETKGNLVYKPVGGDPFSAARERPVGGDPFSSATKRPKYDERRFMSGPGPSTTLYDNPAFWLIAGVSVFIALEAAGITHLSSHGK